MALLDIITRFGLRRAFAAQNSPSGGWTRSRPRPEGPGPPGVPVAKQRMAPAASSKDGAWTPPRPAPPSRRATPLADMAPGWLQERAERSQ